MRHAKSWQVRAALAVCLLATGCRCATIYSVGEKDDWPSQWKTLTGLNDSTDDNIAGDLDIVDSALCTGDINANYNGFLCVRMHLHSDSISSDNLHYIMIDVVGKTYNPDTLTFEDGDDGKADFALVWYKPNDKKSQLLIIPRETAGEYWNEISWKSIKDAAKEDKKDDNTNNGNGNGNNKKTSTLSAAIVEEISTGSLELAGTEETDTFVTYTDIYNEDFGLITEVNYAVSWEYLSTELGLDGGLQEWRLTFATSENSTDTYVTSDVAGGATPYSFATEGWSDQVTVPEPATLGLLVFGALVILRRKRIG